MPQDYVNSVNLLMFAFVLLLCVALLVFALLYNYRARLKAAQQLRRLADTDQITGYWSYSRFKSEVANLLGSDAKTSFAAVFIAVGDFALFSDLYGHGVSQSVLRKLADFFYTNLDDSEFFARYDEARYVLIARFTDQASLAKRLRELNEAVRYYFGSLYPDFELSLRAGAAEIQPDDRDADSVLWRCSFALSQARATARPIVFYSRDARGAQAFEKNLASVMHQSIKGRGFILEYQPKYDVDSKKVAGAEALVRWLHPQKGLLCPDEFVSILEQKNCIQALDLYVFEEVCRFLEARLAENKPVVPISCNFSRLHLTNPELAAILTGIARSHGVAPSLLQIEITESIAVENLDLAEACLKNVSKAGFSIAIDDFMAGNSVLSLFRRVHFDAVKLDKSAMGNFEQPGIERDILLAVLAIAQKNGIQIVCEGAERPDQVEIAKEHGCRIIQGFLYSKPLSGDAFSHIID